MLAIIVRQLGTANSTSAEAVTAVINVKLENKLLPSKGCIPAFVHHIGIEKRHPGIQALWQMHIRIDRQSRKSSADEENVEHR
jgi:hypothetical protein